MPQGGKSAYSGKQKRKAEHIEEGYEKRGGSHREAERRAWATVNKQDGGGKRGGSASRKGQSARSGGSKSRSKSSGRKSSASRGR